MATRADRLENKGKVGKWPVATGVITIVLLMSWEETKPAGVLGVDVLINGELHAGSTGVGCALWLMDIEKDNSLAASK